MAPPRDGLLRLGDGRQLLWTQWGPSGGTPLLSFHGAPSSRLEHLREPLLHSARVEQITVDRPGIGGSSPHPGRRVGDWTRDVEQLTDALGLSLFAVLGHSTGGAYALACAATMPERVTAVGIVGSNGPWNEPTFANLVPPHVRPIRDAWATDPDAAIDGYRQAFTRLRDEILRDPGGAVDRFAARALSEADIALIREDRYLRAILERATVDHVARDVNGLLDERLAGHIWPWGFDLANVKPHVHVFQGTDDVLVPPHVGRALAEHLPNATYHALPGVGHYLPAEHERRVVNVLLGNTRSLSP